MKTSELLRAKMLTATREYLQSGEGRRMIAKCAKLIKIKEGPEAAKAFINDMAINSAI